MLRKLVIGVGSGYFLKVIQTLCGILLLPFVISDANLGLSGYGTLASLLVVQAFLSMLLDGWRLNVSKIIGENKDSPIISYQLALISAVLVAPLAALIIYCGDFIVGLLGVETSYSGALYPICFLVFIEQISYSFIVLHHAFLKTWRVNAIVSLEVLLRTLGIVLVFSYWRADINVYLYIWASASLLVFMSLFISAIMIHPPAIFGLFKNLPVYSIKDSLPLTFKSLSSFLVLRGGIVYANRYIGSEAAALLSIIITTIRGYFFQAFFSVIRPMIIPITSKVNIRSISGEKKEKMLAILFGYQLVVLVIMVAVAFSISYWMPLWLPTIPSEFYYLITAAIIVCMLEIQCSPINQLLVSQGYGNRLSALSIIASVMWAFLLFLYSVFWEVLDIAGIVGYSLTYLFIYNGIIVTYLSTKYLSNISPNFKYGLSIIVSCIIPFIFFTKYTTYPNWLSFSGVSLLSIIMFHYLIKPYSEIVLYTKKIRLFGNS